MVNNDEDLTVKLSNLDFLINGIYSKKMCLNTVRCKVMYLRTKKTGHTHRMEDCIWEISDSVKDADAVAKRAYVILECINRQESSEQE